MIDTERDSREGRERERTVEREKGEEKGKVRGATERHRIEWRKSKRGE